MKQQVRIGTSGWHYKHWLGNFYPAEMRPAQMLPFYYQHFDTVEINNSFYRLPTAECFSCWRESVPRNFLFAVKGSRFLTHMKKLSDPEGALQNLLPRAEELGGKLGPILFQLPPKWRLNRERLETFLGALSRRHQYAFEFREPSWHTVEVYELLRRHNAAFCAFDLAGFQSPTEVTADFAYVRLHGPGGKYQGSYSAAALRGWARRIERWRQSLRHVYVYLDNDQAGYAATNALTLKRMVESSAETRAA